MERIKELYNRYVNNEISAKELEEFLSLVPGNELTVSALMDGTWEEMFAEKITKIIPIYRRSWFSVAAAAVVLAIITFAVTFNFKPGNKDQITIIKHDVTAPVSNKATITLANGKQIILDSANNGTLAHQGNVNVIKLADGQIAYNGTSSEVQYNTLNNPRGSKVISLTLADGSKVWLNAESSLKYPTAFVGDRKVEITGEAYFEVKHNAAQPFTVLANGTEIHDIGTAFNVNAYADEEKLKVTLVEGSIQVSNKVLKPGEQIQVGNEIKIVAANVEEATAWKNGTFQFEGADIKVVMRQIARWYDVEVEYKGNVDQHFRGTISRNVAASKVFEMLELTKAVHFEIEGKKVIVK